MNAQESNTVELFYQQHPEWRRDANTGSLLEQSTRPVTIQSLVVAAYQLRDTLLLSEELEEAWEDHKFYNPTETGLAHRNEFVEQQREAAAKAETESLIKQLGEKFQGQSLERLREIQEKRRVHGLTASEFKQERAAAPKEAPRRQYDGYPDLPDYLVLPGQIQATRIDAAFLNNLIRTDYYLYRRLFSKFGGQQLTDRQNATTVAGESK